MSDQIYTKSDVLLCSWSKLEVMEEGKLAIVIQRLHSPDMTGAIQMAKAVMPNVFMIYVFHERIHSDTCETVYKLNGRAEPPSWEAFDTRKTAK